MLGTVRLQRTILDALAIFALAAATGLGVRLWPSLPARVPIHFDASGLPNGFASRSVGAFLRLRRWLDERSCSRVCRNTPSTRLWVDGS